MRQPEHPPSLPRRLEENHDLRLGCERSDVQPGDGRQAAEGGKLRRQDAGAAGFRLLPLKSLLGLGRPLRRRRAVRLSRGVRRRSQHAAQRAGLLVGPDDPRALDPGAATAVLLAGGHDDWTKRPGKRAQVTKDQVDAVRALASERIRVAIDLAVSTRQRRGDLLTVRREHLTDEGIVFRQSKTRAGVLIEWSEELRAIVERAKRLPAASSRGLSDPQAQRTAVHGARLLRDLAAPDGKACEGRRSAVHLP
jgi:integrase